MTAATCGKAPTRDPETAEYWRLMDAMGLDEASRREEYGLRFLFDADRHQEKFFDYCELVIGPDGVAHYAVPGHQPFIEAYGARLAGISPSEFAQRCPRSMMLDYLTWLMRETGCVCCWSKGWSGEPNARQKAALLDLFERGLVANRKIL